MLNVKKTIGNPKNNIQNNDLTELKDDIKDSIKIYILAIKKRKRQ